MSEKWSFDVDKWRREEEEKRKKKAESLITIADFLNKCGYKYIVVQYQGSGDCGDAFEAEGYLTEEDFKQSEYDGGEYIVKSDWSNENQKRTERPESEWEWSRQQIELRRCMEKYNALDDTKIELNYLLSDLIGYDWYNNEGGQGRVILDTTKKTLTVEGQQNTNAHIEVESKRYLDNSKPFVETVGNDVIDRGW